MDSKELTSSSSADERIAATITLNEQHTTDIRKIKKKKFKIVFKKMN